MNNWREIIQKILNKQKNKVAEINLEKEKVNYSKKSKAIEL